MIKLTCTNCETQYEFKDDKLEYDLVSSDPKRQMGVENEYTGIIEHVCETCDNHIKVEFNFWEYPEGALNYSEFSQEGCIVTEEPDYKNYLPISQEPSDEI